MACACKGKSAQAAVKFVATLGDGKTKEFTNESAAKLAVARNGGSYTKA